MNVRMVTFKSVNTFRVYLKKINDFIAYLLTYTYLFYFVNITYFLDFLEEPLLFLEPLLLEPLLEAAFLEVDLFLLLERDAARLLTFPAISLL